MFGAIAMLFILPWLDTSKIRSMRYRPQAKIYFMIFVLACIALGFCGARLPEDAVIPGGVGFQFIDYNINSFVWLSRISAGYYFVYFLIITPLLGLRETPLAVPESISTPVLAHPAGAPAGAAARQGRAPRPRAVASRRGRGLVGAGPGRRGRHGAPPAPDRRP